jgi:uncharacterized membrane protein YesL
MNKNTYKNYLATGILLGIVAFIGGIIYFSLYASNEAKEMVMIGLVVILSMALLTAVWFGIRTLID